MKIKGELNWKEEIGENNCFLVLNIDHCLIEIKLVQIAPRPCKIHIDKGYQWQFVCDLYKNIPEEKLLNFEKYYEKEELMSYFEKLFMGIL